MSKSQNKFLSGRRKSGQIALELLKVALNDPKTKLRTGDFTKRLKLINQTSKRNNRSRLSMLCKPKIGLLLRDKNNFYTLPKNYLSVEYLDKIIDTFGSITEIMKFFPSELRYQYIEKLAKKEVNLSKFPELKRDELVYESAKRVFLFVLFVKLDSESLKEGFNFAGTALEELAKSKSKKTRYKAEALLEVRDIYNELKHV